MVPISRLMLLAFLCLLATAAPAAIPLGTPDPWDDAGDADCTTTANVLPSDVDQQHSLQRGDTVDWMILLQHPTWFSGFEVQVDELVGDVEVAVEIFESCDATEPVFTTALGADGNARFEPLAAGEDLVPYFVRIRLAPFDPESTETQWVVYTVKWTVQGPQFRRDAARQRDATTMSVPVVLDTLSDVLSQAQIESITGFRITRKLEPFGEPVVLGTDGVALRYCNTTMVCEPDGRRRLGTVTRVIEYRDTPPNPAAGFAVYTYEIAAIVPGLAEPVAYFGTSGSFATRGAAAYVPLCNPDREWCDTWISTTPSLLVDQETGEEYLRVDALGGEFPIDLTASNCQLPPLPCSWHFGATANGWLTLPNAGSGDARVAIAVAPNTNLLTRTAVVTVTFGSGETRRFAVRQAGACVYTLPTPAATIEGAGGVFEARVETASICPVTAVPTVDWITIVSIDREANNLTRVYYRAAPNPGMEMRQGHITINGLGFLVQQIGSPYLYGDVYEPNETLDLAMESLRAIDIVSGPRLIRDLRLVGEDWYRIEFPRGRSMRLTIEFNHAEGDLQLQLLNPHLLESNNFPVRLGESYGTGNSESVIFTDRYGFEQLALRVYDERGWSYSNQPYHLIVEDLGPDDPHEPNQSPCTARSLAANVWHENLIARDDDFFVFDISGRQTATVRMEHAPLSGQLYFEVLVDVGSDCRGQGFNGAGNGFVPNRGVNEERLDLRAVPGRTQLVVRVYSPNRGANLYRLRVTTE